jgi:hypothetical protein
MIEFLKSIEQLQFSTWIREGGSIWGYAFILFTHTIGLASVAGGSLIISLRLLGFAPKIPIKPLERLYPFMWTGFVINAVSGTLLLMADASVKMRNPVFGIKMVLVAVGVVVLQRMRKTVFANAGIDAGPVPGSAKGLAWILILCWLGAITAGRLLAYLGPVAGLA